MLSQLPTRLLRALRLVPSRMPGLYDEAPPVLPFLGELPQPFAMPAYCLATEWQRPGPGLNNAGPGPGRSPAVCRANA